MSILKTKPKEESMPTNAGWASKSGELLVSVKNLVPRMVSELEEVKKLIEEHPEHPKGT